MKGKRLTAALAASLAVAAAVTGTAAATGAFSNPHRDREERALAAALHDRDPKNVIFLLGDGMGTQEITAARYYQGVTKELNVDPDSASTGTMWATGEKTIDERISQGPSSAENVPGVNLKTVLEIAQKRGMKVGDVSTAEITDATPAVRTPARRWSNRPRPRATAT